MIEVTAMVNIKPMPTRSKSSPKSRYWSSESEIIPCAPCVLLVAMNNDINSAFSFFICHMNFLEPVIEGSNLTVELTRQRESKHPSPHQVTCDRRSRGSRSTTDCVKTPNSAKSRHHTSPDVIEKRFTVNIRAKIFPTSLPARVFTRPD